MMLLTQLKKNYSEIQNTLKTALDAMQKMITSTMIQGHKEKMELKLSDFIDPKYREALWQRLERMLADDGLCVNPLSADDIVVYRNKLSRYLTSIGEAASYRLLLQNYYFYFSASCTPPVYQCNFTEDRQQDIIDILSAVIRASENGESYVLCQCIGKDLNNNEDMINAVCKVFFLKREKIMSDSYKIYGWADDV